MGPIFWTPLFPSSSENGRNSCTTARYNARVTTYYSVAPIGAKKFSPIPQSMDLEVNISKLPPKCIWAQNASFWPQCDISVAREPPISLPSHSRFEKTQLALERPCRKNFAQKPGPPPAQHVAAPGSLRVERVPLHHHDSEIGRIGSQFAHSRSWSGRGAHHSIPSAFWGPRIFSSTLCTIVWENNRKGGKNPPCAEDVPNILGGAENALRWPQKIYSSTTGQLYCRSRAFHRLHITEAQNAQLGPKCGGKIIPGPVSSGVSSPSSPFSMTQQILAPCIIIENNAQNVSNCRGRAFPSSSSSPLKLASGSREHILGLTKVFRE